MSNYKKEFVVYYDDEDIYFVGKQSDIPLFVPINIPEKTFSTEEEMMKWVKDYENTLENYRERV